MDLDNLRRKTAKAFARFMSFAQIICCNVLNVLFLCVICRHILKLLVDMHNVSKLITPLYSV